MLISCLLFVTLQIRKIIKPVPFKPLKAYDSQPHLNNHNMSNIHLNHQLINTSQKLLSVVPIHHSSSQRSTASRASRGTNGSMYSSPFSSLDSETEVNGLNNVSSKLISVSSSNLQRVDSITKSNLSQSHTSLSRSCSAVAVDEEHWYLEPTLIDKPTPELGFKLPPPVNWAASRRRPLMYSTEYISQTPSPNDSLIVELEALLREKDNEIGILRETLERNEQVSKQEKTSFTQFPSFSKALFFLLLLLLLLFAFNLNCFLIGLGTTFTLRHGQKIL